MAYDTVLAERIRPFLLPRTGVIEKSMFGGIGFLINGNMCCGIWHDMLVIRLSPEEAVKALKKPHVRVMDITGKPMKGWLLVEPKGLAEDADLYGWMERAFSFASALPKKAK